MFFVECVHNIATSHGLVISLFLAGLVGGFAHCVGMCGPFVLAQTGHVQKLSGALLIPYHLGRMTTYVGLAILVNTVINLAFIFSEFKTLLSVPLLLLAAVIFMVTAFPKLSVVFPWVIHLQTVSPFKFIAKMSGFFSNNPGILKRYILGVLLGFMPCGLVVAALMATTAAQSVFQAGTAMAAFTFGTIIALVFVGIGGQALRHKHPKFSAYVSRGALIVSSLWLCTLAGVMVF